MGDNDDNDDDDGSINDYNDVPPTPPLYVPSMKNAEFFGPVFNRTQPGIIRTCRKAVDLYVLQPNRLNMSGSFNPLKGKLTNCHATGCERFVPLIPFKFKTICVLISLNLFNNDLIIDDRKIL